MTKDFGESKFCVILHITPLRVPLNRCTTINYYYLDGNNHNQDSRSGAMRMWHGIWRFYIDGFKSMTIGKSLWVLILIKLFVIFAVLKLFFFPDILSSRYDNDSDRADAVRTHLTK